MRAWLQSRWGYALGRARMFTAGLWLFLLASALCGLAQTQEMLLGARFPQGVGGALCSAVILGMIVRMYPEPRERAAAIGAYSFVASAGACLALLVGGVLTEAISWSWIFYVNLPIGILAALVGSRVIDRDRGIGLAEGADVPGASLITASLMLGAYAIVTTAENGWVSARTLGLGGVALVLFGAFLLRQRTARTPLVPLRIFPLAHDQRSELVMALMIPGLTALFFLGALYLQGTQGYGPVEVGLAFTPLAVLIGVVSLKGAAPLLQRFGAKRILVVGLLAACAGLLLFARTPSGVDYLTDLLPTMLLFGTGAGLAFPAIVSLAMSSATDDDAGLISGLVNTSQQIGAALGLAVLATLAGTRTEQERSTGTEEAAALIGGYELAFLVAAGLVAVAATVAATVLEPTPTARAAPGAAMPVRAATTSTGTA